LGARVESEFGEDAFDMAIGGALGDDQALGDLTIRQPAFDQLSDLEFSLAEWRPDIGARGSAPVVPNTENEIDHVVKITEAMRVMTIIGPTICTLGQRMPGGEPR
jgi:hypothetical protein